MFVLLSELRDLIAAVQEDVIGEVWVQDDLTIRQLPMDMVTSAITCTAQSGERVQLWRGEVETAGLRTPEKAPETIAAVRARLDAAMMIMSSALHTALPGAQLRKGLFLEPGLFAELAGFKGEQHIWVVRQPDGLSTRTVVRQAGVTDGTS